MALSRKPIEIVEQGNHQLLTKAEHWERAFLADVAQVQNGYAFKSELFTHSDGMPLIRIRDIEDGYTENFYSGEYSEEFVVRRGDILIGMDGDFNAAIWHGSDGLLNQRVCRIIPTAKSFPEKFLFLCLQPYLNAINAETSSVTVKHLSSKTIGEIPLPLPPLNEQHRIVAKIEELFSELDQGIENLKTAREQLKVYRQALLKHAFEGKLTAQWREQNRDRLESAAALLARIQTEREQRYQQQLQQWRDGSFVQRAGRPKAPKPLPPLTSEELSAVPELPEGWGWTRFGLLDIELKRGPFGSSITKAMFVPRGFKVYEQGNAIYRDAIRGNYFINTEKYEELSGFAALPGDFVVSCAGTVGKIYELPENATAGVINQALMRVRINEKILSKPFFAKLFESGFFQRKVLSDAKGTAMVNLAGIKELNLVPVAICSISEQIQIVAELESKLSETDQLELTLTASLQQAEALRQSILKKAFSGQLVAQDANDEPAAALLARIKAERTETGNNAASSRRARKVSA